MIGNFGQPGNRRRLRVWLLICGLVIGAFTGVIIAALRELIDIADAIRPIWFSDFAGAGKIFLTLGSLIFIAWFMNWAINLDGQVGGSGILQIKKILHGQATMSKNPLRLIALKFTAVVLGIGAGLSLGRAGISVQLGACVGNFFNKVFFSEKIGDKNIHGEILFTAGAGAGLAAVFNAPLAAVFFCIEELQRKFSPEVLVATVAATVSASTVTELVFGVRPLFATITPSKLSAPGILKVPTFDTFAMMSAEPLKFFLCFVTLGIFLGALGVIFTRAMVFSLDVYDRLKIFGVKRFLIPLLLIIPLGMNIPQILGCGNVMVNELLSGKFALQFVIILFAGKFLFTLISFGTNAAGGVFLPILSLGALSGSLFSSGSELLGIFSTEWTTLFITFGMAAFFAGATKTPITGSILILEVTGQISYLLTLMIVSGAAFMAADFLGGEPIFSALLNRSKNFCAHVKSD